MRRISAFHLFLIALWWPLPLLPGVRWEDAITPFILSCFAWFLKLVGNQPAQQRHRWEGATERHRVPWKELIIALIALEAVLLLFIRVFGSGQEQVEPYAGWLAPIGEALTPMLPKFRLMAGKLVEMGVPERVNLVVVAWAIGYAGQIALAALWVPPTLRRFREATPPDEVANAGRWRRRFLRWSAVLFVVVVLILAIFDPEAKDVRGRKELFHEFETRDVDLLFRVVLHSTMYWQVAFFCLLYPMLFRARAQPRGTTAAE